MCLHEAYDIVIVLAGTLRAVSMDDFEDAVLGRSSKRNEGGSGGNSGGNGGEGKGEMSLHGLMHMVKAMQMSSSAKSPESK